jgi:hypothetical protein
VITQALAQSTGGGAAAGGIFALALLLLLIPLYLLPTIVAVKKNRRQMTAIFILNLLLGWTIIGWAGAMVWAFIEDRPAA